jgi:hypothetical protein
LLPEIQKKGWNDLWNTENWDYVVEVGNGMTRLVADVSLHDDGKRVYVGLYCREPIAMNEGLKAIARCSHSKQREVQKTSEMHARITFEGDHDEARAIAREAVAAACAAMSALGYKSGALHATPKHS